MNINYEVVRGEQHEDQPDYVTCFAPNYIETVLNDKAAPKNLVENLQNSIAMYELRKNYNNGLIDIENA
jgi:hypothetical protein